MPSGHNLFDPVPGGRSGEWVDLLANSEHVRVERIVSHGQASPPGFWYDQQESEWVAVLSGQATLRFQDAPDAVHLGPGDQLLIPAHRKHRVEATSQQEPTIWLAVFFPENSP